MKDLIKYPSIEQFRHVVKNIAKLSEELPVVDAVGTVKLHGTNGGVCYSNGELWAQSRNNILTVNYDNAGFAFFVEKNRDWFLDFFEDYKNRNSIKDDSVISLFGEWVGEGIQSKVAISQIEKSFFVFGLKVDSKWESVLGIRNRDRRIFNVTDYKKFYLKIDFNNPAEAQESIDAFTQGVEKRCPIAFEQFDIDGIGEGIVWQFDYAGYLHNFKSKGDSHVNAKQKKNRERNVNYEAKKEIAEKITPSWRLAQGLENIFGVGYGKSDIDRKRLGEYIKWVIDDVAKEDLDYIVESGFEFKQIMGFVSNIAKDYFFALEKDF